MNYRINLATIFVSATSLALAGCGSGGTPKYPVSGRVTFEGKPVVSGQVLFIPPDKSQRAEAGQIVDGKFQFESTAGPQRVEIQALRPIPGSKPMMGAYPEENFLPPKYHKETTLTAEVTPEGPNQFVFELTAE